VRGSLQAVLVTVLVCVFSATIGATVGSSQTRSVAGTISLRAFAGETVITPKVASASTAPDGFPSFSRFAEQVQTLPNLSPKPGWPSPVDDREHRLFTLVDVLEYRPRVGSKETNDDYRWDIEGWYGGDYNRVWFKSEGQRDTAFKANYDVDFQLLYGRFIRKYYDFQIGGRVETQSFRGSNVTRGLAAIGIEGLVPYNYQIEPTLFIAQNGAVSARLSLTKDLLMTQRLILQLRFETNAAIQRVVEFTTGSGLNNLEFGFRLRYEIRRGFAPYVGLSLDRSFGDTATLVRQEGGNPSQVRLAAGVRMWF
jgi:copper resistance protein B